MDSIYDKPRRAPIASTTPNIVSWVVPNVSMYQQYDQKKRNADNELKITHMNQSHKQVFINDTVNNIEQTEHVSFTRKLVRFKMPQNLEKETALRKISTSNGFKPIPENITHMANIPNRNLDLSNIGFSRIINKSQSSTMIQQKPAESKLCSEEEPTVKDLLKIIEQQNEKLTSLQAQVRNLIDFNQRQNTIEPIKPLQTNFTMDVNMTNIELSITSTKIRNPITHNISKSKAQDIREEMSRIGKNFDVSLCLNESVTIQKENESPDTSIHVDMEDYSSESEDEDPSSFIGWTVYNNVMNQVSYILNKPKKKKIFKNSDSSNILCKIVKEETIRQLKNMGVALPKINSADSFPRNIEEIPSPREVSIAVKQLIIKYLPDVKMTKLRNNKENFINHDEITHMPAISMATVQYMEKYNLLD